MTVALPNSTVLVMNPELGALVLTDLSAGINCVLLGIVMTRRPSGAAFLYIPSTFWVGKDMVGLRSSFCVHKVSVRLLGVKKYSYTEQDTLIIFESQAI
jgi:hypothetical protein